MTDQIDAPQEVQSISGRCVECIGKTLGYCIAGCGALAATAIIVGIPATFLYGLYEMRKEAIIEYERDRGEHFRVARV